MRSSVLRVVDPALAARLVGADEEFLLSGQPLSGRVGALRSDGHLRWLVDRLGEDLLDVAGLTAGRHAYRRRDGIAVVPTAMLGP